MVKRQSPSPQCGKTNFVIFRGYRKPCDHNVTLLINKKAIEQKNYVKYLGILIDEHLNWKEHICIVTKKISRSVGIICKLRLCLNTSLLRTIYYSLVYSHLNYGIHVWGSACDTDQEKFFSCKKRLSEQLPVIGATKNIVNPVH